MNKLLFTLIICCPLAHGLSESEEIFEYADPSLSTLPGVQLLDQTNHRIKRRDIADPTATTSGPPSIIEDNHVYYNLTVAINHALSAFYGAEFNRIFATYPTITNHQLNNAKNRAAEVKLKFPFDFYGHPVQTLVVTTGGFLYVNEISHPYLPFSQYIAPLMAEFETVSAAGSSITFVDVENAFWVRWENLLLSRNASLGKFSFQCVLFRNGSIVFDYISIPISMAELKSVSPLLKVGLSDAFYYDVKVPQLGTVMRRIVKYHDLTVPLKYVVTDGIIRLVHLPTCNQQSSCQTCVNRTRVPGFNCSWCYELHRCSSGVDRQLQLWHDSDCHYLNDTNCSGGGRAAQLRRASQLQAGRTVLGVCLGLLALIAVACLVGALVYGYRHPGSRLGAWLIQHRPGRLFRSGGGGGGSGGDSIGSYRVGGDNPYVNFSKA